MSLATEEAVQLAILPPAFRDGGALQQLGGPPGDEARGRVQGGRGELALRLMLHEVSQDLRQRARLLLVVVQPQDPLEHLYIEGRNMQVKAIEEVIYDL